MCEWHLRNSNPVHGLKDEFALAVQTFRMDRKKNTRKFPHAPHSVGMNQF